MVSSLCVLSSVTVRRRVQVVGASFCVRTFGISNLISSPADSSYLNAFRTGGGQSLQLLLSVSSGSKFGSRSIESGSATVVVEYIVVYVTVTKKEAGKKLAESIIKERLVSCVNRVPGIESVYQWQGKIETDSEELLIIKKRKSLLEPLTQHVKANHEYEVPEVIALPILGVNDKYLEWIKSST